MFCVELVISVGVPTALLLLSTIPAAALNAAAVDVPCLITFITYTFFSETTAPCTVPSTMIPEPWFCSNTSPLSRLTFVPNVSICPEITTLSLSTKSVS